MSLQKVIQNIGKGRRRKKKERRNGGTERVRERKREEGRGGRKVFLSIPVPNSRLCLLIECHTTMHLALNP